MKIATNNPMLPYLEEIAICTIEEAPEYFAKGWMAFLAEYIEGQPKKLIMGKFNQQV